PYPVFPLGIAVVEQTLKKAGYKTRLWDVQLEEKPISHAISDFSPDYIGISLRNIDNVNSRSPLGYIDNLRDLVQEIRHTTSVPIILGGSGFSLFPDDILQLTKADFGVIGEADTTLPALLDAIKNNQETDSIPGVYTRTGNNISKQAMTPIKSSEIELAYYDPRLSSYYHQESTILSVQTQRGCAFRCCYCTYPLIEGKKPRSRNFDDVCDDIENALEAGAPYIFMVDSVLNSSEKHITDLCNAIINRGLKFPWGGFLRPQHITEDLACAMKEAGMKHAELGSDSFSNTVLKSYRKPFDFEDILESQQALNKYKLHSCHFIILGGPGETPDTMEETFENADLLQNTLILPSIGMRIYPNTALAETAIKEGVIKPDQNLLPPTFYLSPTVEQKYIESLLREKFDQHDHWIDFQDDALFSTIRERFHKRKVSGPLWEYMSLFKRMSQ
ncbi:MAG: cobalamin-dependent protein, partial [Verrucomicrobiae bacterium]|nr:cobalamin-dependent protein [Verrucomicrobiae bacterium]NNJ87478.1 radical SAM protein [Akkermansiaceae bacterium]